MQALVDSLTSLPGVLGGMICAQDGQMLARAFPATFDEGALQQAASVLADGCVGLDTVTGSLGLVDLRYGEARVVARPVPHGLLLLLCARNVNLQLLLISVAATSKKIEKLLADAEAAAAAAPAPEPAPAQAARAAESPAEAPADEEPGSKKRKKNWWPSV